jgi:hypothetical protein
MTEASTKIEAEGFGISLQGRSVFSRYTDLSKTRWTVELVAAVR